MPLMEMMKYTMRNSVVRIDHYAGAIGRDAINGVSTVRYAGFAKMIGMKYAVNGNDEIYPYVIGFLRNDRCAGAIGRDAIYDVSTVVGVRGSQKMIEIEILRNWK